MGRIRRTVDAVIAAADAYSGMAVDYRRCRVCGEDGRTALAKPGGLYVLTDMDYPGGAERVWVEGDGYQRMEVILKRQIVTHVFLIPDRNAPLDGSATVISGTCVGRELIAVTQRKGRAGRLAADCAAGESKVSLYPSREILEGRTLVIADGTGREWIELAGEEGKGRFRLSYSLRERHARKDSILCDVFRVPLGQDGGYYLPLSRFPEEGGICCMLVDGRAVEAGGICHGKENRFDC